MDRVDKILFAILVLSAIVFIGALIVDFTDYGGIERPFNFALSSINNDFSPADRVKESQIKVYNDKVVIEIPNAKWTKFAPTDSMTPFFDEGSNAIQIIPESPDQIEKGDIISYESLREETKGIIIIHRVIEKGIDEDGVYFIAKGDNNPQSDPEKIRFNQIKRVLVGIIY